jgi:hypothetical protein
VVGDGSAAKPAETVAIYRGCLVTRGLVDRSDVVQISGFQRSHPALPWVFGDVLQEVSSIYIGFRPPRPAVSPRQVPLQPVGVW